LGSVEVKQLVVRELVYAVASKFAADGFKFMVVLGAHGGPRHIVALEEAAAKISWRYRLRGARLLAPFGGFITSVLSGKLAPQLEEKMKERNTPMSPEERDAMATDYHAGMVETSLMMVVRPDLVKPQYKDLKPAIVKKFWMIRPTSGQTVGGGFGHLGSPHLARPEIGHAAIDVLMEQMTPLLERFLAGDRKVSRETRSVFYYIPLFRPMFMYAGFLAASLVVFYMLMAYFMTFIGGL
jgi:creatinine amidohydrolase/Fe(II)-dependent formamide hydrolase-like protein